MKFVFLGTPEIATPVLEALFNAGLIPAAVVTNPDKPQGRKQIITPPPVKQFVLERLAADATSTTNRTAPKILQPEKLNENFLAEISALDPDIFIVAAYSKLIPKSILSVPRLGTIGAHPSLLPKYRGPSPIQTAILDGAPEVGMSLYLIDEKMDEGPIVAQRKLENYTPGTLDNIQLSKKLFALGGEMLVEVINNSGSDFKINAKPQDHSSATYTKKFSTEDAFVPEEELRTATSGEKLEAARNIHNKILAFTPEPGTWTIQNGKRTKLLASRIENGKLILTKIQEEGKTPRDVAQQL
jgi:methionyl-tRNA formyltransferase